MEDGEGVRGGGGRGMNYSPPTLWSSYGSIVGSTPPPLPPSGSSTKPNGGSEHAARMVPERTEERGTRGKEEERGWAGRVIHSDCLMYAAVLVCMRAFGSEGILKKPVHTKIK